MIRDYGEDNFAKNIARQIVLENARRVPSKQLGNLTEIIKHAIPMKYQKSLGHPAKKNIPGNPYRIKPGIGSF